jgi:dipeptidyl aminopeptidase/acylaminoacyl peptidase
VASEPPPAAGRAAPRVVVLIRLEVHMLALRPTLVGVALGVLASGCARGPEPPRVASGHLTIDRLLEFRHPGQPAWSPDGSRIAYVWDQGGVQNLWTLDAHASPTPAPRQVTRFEFGTIDGPWWDRDGARLYFVHDGDLWQAPVDGGPASAVWKTPVLEDQAVPSPDGRRVAFVRGDAVGVPDWQRTEGDLWVRTMADGREVRLTHGLGVVSAPAWSPDGTYLAFALSKVTPHSEAPAYSGAKILYTRVDHGPSTPAFVPASGGTVTRLPPSPSWDTSPLWLDRGRLLVHRVLDDNKTRELMVADVPSGRTQVIYREVDPLFWSLGFVAPDPVVSPDGRLVAFVSDRDGWDHLYIVPSAGGGARQVTTGHYEVRHPAWSPDSRVVAFDRSAEDAPGVRQVAVAVVGSGLTDIRVRDLTAGRGTNIAPLWAPDSRRVLYQHADSQHSADLFVKDSGPPPADAARLTDSMPPEVDRGAFVAPELVGYRAADGRKVPAYLFVPRGLDRSKKHPAIIWVHGDGINQNYDGWHVERNYAVYYSFHQYLLQKGYVVLAPDYRGSIGYGREWRQQVYMDVGGKDAQDAISGADYLKTLPYVDADRIGIWGLSYGGFFTLIALTDRPTTFRCGIDVAGVPDFGMWYVDPGGSWVTSRMGTPADNPAVYERAAPINRMDRLARPLLILHGTSDVNVPFVESVRLVDVLLKLHKDFGVMVYPGEFHYFQRAHVLRDAWKRSEAFFDQHLAAGQSRR